MSALRRPVRPLTFASVLLLTTAIAAPALAQIETVVVTAQKRTQNAQSVPIAMSALSSRDLAAHQITQFQDLQFLTPDVTYTKGNFTGSDFQIRGIGVSSVGYDAESGVAINMDDVYLATPLLAESTFYDLQRIEVLRGPQSTLYVRGADRDQAAIEGNTYPLRLLVLRPAQTGGKFEQVRNGRVIDLTKDRLGRERVREAV